jgi:single-strand DNA-binding protein
MVSLNRVLLIGNLTRDPELRYTPAGAGVCEFAIGVNRSWTDKKSGEKKDEVSFIDIATWGRTAELCAEYLKTGRSGFVEGRLTQDRWEDTKTGQKRSKIRVTAERVQFLGARTNGGAPAAGGEAAAPVAEMPEELSEQSPPDADIPF